MTERGLCVLVSLYTTAFRIPADLCALEVFLKGDDPCEYGGTIETHPLMSGNRYEGLVHFLTD